MPGPTAAPIASPPRRTGRWRLLSVLPAVAVVLAACSGMQRATIQPELELLSSGPLELPATCQVAGGEIYRAQFTVAADGSVKGISAHGESECAREAVAGWVSTFRYLPPQREVAAVLDWMPVIARRGG
jgi:hypothetical protein